MAFAVRQRTLSSLKDLLVKKKPALGKSHLPKSLEQLQTQLPQDFPDRLKSVYDADASRGDYIYPHLEVSLSCKMPVAKFLEEYGRIEAMKVCKAHWLLNSFLNQI